MTLSCSQSEELETELARVQQQAETTKHMSEAELQHETDKLRSELEAKSQQADKLSQEVQEVGRDSY